MNSYRDLIKLYKKQFKKFGDSVKSQLTPKGRNNIRYSSVLDYINFDEKIRILDYGCGTGYFLKSIIRRNYSIVGYEPIKKNDNPLIFSSLSSDEKERLSWIRESALYFDKHRKAKISMVDEKTFALKILNQFEPPVIDPSERSVDSEIRDSLLVDFFEDSGNQNLY